MPREKLLSYFSRGDLSFSSDFHLSFVCGASDPLPGCDPLLRRQFLDWAQAEEPKLVCVRAESAVTDLLRRVDERREGRNLGVIENTIAETVDSLLIFPESPGSFAELGMFSVDDAISKKMLIALMAEFQGDSFITLGPVRRVGARSVFSPLPLVLTNPVTDGFRQIANRLLGEIRQKRGYRKRYSIHEWKDYSKREKLAIIDSIINLTGIITEEDLFDIVLNKFGAFEASEIRLLAAMLAALGRVKITDDADLVRISSASPEHFLEGGGSELTELKVRWIEAYRLHLPEAIRDFEAVNP